MGSWFSLFLNNASCYGGRDLLKSGLGDLPESCVAMILKNLDPVEICKFSKLNKAFLTASWADFVWESKLPPDYKLILEKILGDFPESLLKRDVFTFLSRVNSFDHGTKDKQMEALVEKLCNKFSGVTYGKQWEYIMYSLSLLTFTEKGIKKLIESFKSYEHALAEDLVTENFRSIINKGKKFVKPELKACVEEFEEKVNKFHMEKKEQEEKPQEFWGILT